MKKMFLGLCAMALAMAACQPDGYKVSGVAEGFKDGDTLYFFAEMGKSQTPTDTIFVKNGKFKLEGPVDSVTLASVVASDGSAGALFFREKGSIDVTLSRTNPSKVGGTKANKALQKINELQAQYSVKFDSLTAPLYMEDDLSDERRDQLMNEYQAAEQELLVKFIDVAEANINNELGYLVVTSMAGSKELPAIRLKELIEKMPAEYQQRQPVVEIVKRMEAAERTSKGKTMPDFTLPKPDGTELSVMSEVAKNKITILDFWASWCAPCCEEMPEMVKLYEKYKDKGLGIVGISLDSRKEKWLEAIENMNMTWTQVGDMKTWNTDPVEIFQIGSIPYVVIVDQQGTILEKGLRGVALEVFIEGQLK